MSGKTPYDYIVLRYVHDVVSGEFVNVGLVLYIPSEHKILVRTRKTIGRLKSIFPDLDRQAFVDTMRGVERGMKKAQNQLLSEGLFADKQLLLSYVRRVVPVDDSALQWGAPAAGITSDVEKTFEQVFERFVARYDVKGAHRRTDEDIWRPVRKLLAERDVHVDFQPKIVVGNSDAIKFSNAWKNGQWHAYEPISLDLVDADGIKDKVRRWRGHLAAVADGASDTVKVHFLVGAPREKSLRDAYESAIDILKGSPFNPEIFEEKDTDKLVSEIEDEYREHVRSGQVQ
ncbi:DUF3037 domain-containing protein [Oricola nitratireducens]|uniref:DUF3037 domain-containing protein n=1 Tax=Oricola nitratireducens TaxID=2775868 RepID=UPI0018695EB5|nr:DUF3037 domain-containing protein [Oricola nitratireducens]